LDTQPKELAPLGADTWPAWAKRTLWKNRFRIAALVLGGTLAALCSYLHGVAATLCHGLAALADVMGG
jgi:hypothetical protein